MSGYIHFIQEALTPKPHWKVQSFRYYAAHYLVGSGLVDPTDGTAEGHVRSLEDALQRQYEIGVEHGRNARLPHPSEDQEQ